MNHLIFMNEKKEKKKKWKKNKNAETEPLTREIKQNENESNRKMK